MSGVTLSLFYFTQPDALAALMLVPPWVWFGLGLLSFLPVIRHYRLIQFRFALMVWMTFLVLHVEQATTLWKVTQWPSRTYQSHCLNNQCMRVISMNCGDGGIRTVEEALPLEPDIILLQESPGVTQLEQLAMKHYGPQAIVVYSWNASLITRGELVEKTIAEDGRFVSARVKIAGGEHLDIVSLRLSPPSFRIDFWSSEFWKDHQRIRKVHRQEIEAVTTKLKLDSAPGPTIIGGDFNSPDYDAAFTSLHDNYRSSFSTSGRGWGGTGTNDWPLFRVDHIWTSQKNIDVGACWSQKTKHSDHRMVIADLILN
jgi:endonuclease/exonuclease/phosphatase family metal-dependent hydrolase